MLRIDIIKKTRTSGTNGFNFKVKFKAMHKSIPSLPRLNSIA